MKIQDKKAHFNFRERRALGRKDVPVLVGRFLCETVADELEEKRKDMDNASRPRLLSRAITALKELRLARRMSVVQEVANEFSMHEKWHAAIARLAKARSEYEEPRRRPAIEIAFDELFDYADRRSATHTVGLEPLQEETTGLGDDGAAVGVFAEDSADLTEHSR